MRLVLAIPVLALAGFLVPAPIAAQEPEATPAPPLLQTPDVAVPRTPDPPVRLADPARAPAGREAVNASAPAAVDDQSGGQRRRP
ncbi:MAG: hypothetical protein AB1635_21700, partial [Acidobacteriota bacterium]